MSTPATFNGSSFTVPAVGDRRWGQNVTNLLVSLAGNALAKSGGNFTLSADVNFGANFGLTSKYFKSVSSNISQTGIVRLANNEGLGFRNFANSADLVLKANASDLLEYNGVAVATATDIALKQDASTAVTLTGAQTVTNKTISTGSKITTAVNEVDATDNTKQLATDLSGATTGTTVTLKSSQTAARTVTLPDATDTLVGKATTDLLTNKSISGATNTFSNIPITATAAFTSAQLAGQVSDETGTGSLVFSSSPTLTTPNLGTPLSVVLSNGTGLPLTSGVTGALPIGNGGTGQVTKASAYDALSPNTTKGDIEVFGTTNTRLPVGANGFAIVADSAQALGVKWAAVSGGLTPVTKTANYTANNNEMVEGDTTTAAFTVTLPTIPAGGGVVGVLDAAGTCSATNFIRITPATGQSLDGYVANDSVLLDYAGANVIAYAAAGATSWKLQKQATTMVQPASTSQAGTLSYYDEGTFTNTWNNTTPSNTTVGVSYVRVGKMVTLSFGPQSGTSASSTNFSTTSGALPAALRPVNTLTMVIPNTAVAGAGSSGKIIIDANGQLQITQNAATGSFTSGSTYSVNAFSVSYTIN